MSARDSQDIVLVPIKPSTAKVRNSQDVVLAVGNQNANVRVSQDVILAVIKTQNPIVQKMIFGEEWDERVPPHGRTLHFQSVELDQAIGPLTYYIIGFTST